MASHYRLGVAVVVGFVLGVTRMAPAASSMRVAVMEFQRGGSSDAQLDSLGKGLQSMVTTDLAQVSSMELVERSRMHDIEAEQKLARSGMVDPKTAVKIGKLAGATHLVTGTYIIVGGKMRLDARLFGVSDGKVLLAEQIEGDKDAFFELEKQLVNKVIGVIGVKIPPKERAEVARVHTADFDAFRRFSDGIGAFDDKKYEEAMAALKEAGTRDASFKLASITLAEYERVITELRTKADAIDSANAQLKRLGDDKSIQEEAAMVKKLYAISTRPGADAQIQRLAALHILALIYGGDSQGHHEKLRKIQDEFAMQRTADTLWKSYFSESIQAFPKVPLNVTDNLEGGLPKPATFDQDFAAFVDALLHYSAGGFSHEDSLLTSGLRVKELSRRMHLDRGQEAALWGKATVLAASLHPGASFKQTLHEAYAKALRAAGDYSKSSTVFARLAAEEKEPAQLKTLANEIEQNKEREQLLKNAKQAKLAREIMLTTHSSWSDRELQEMRTSALGRSRPRIRDLSLLNWGRGMSRTNSDDDSGYVIVDGSPTWMVRGYESLGTGPRSDAVRATELRYYHTRPTAGALAIIDGVPRDELSVQFQIGYTPSADWWPGEAPVTVSNQNDDADVSKLKVVAGRPDVALAFAVRDIDAADRPLRCLQLVIAPDAIRLVELTQKDPNEAGTIKILGDKPANLRSERQLDVEIRVGTRVNATVNGKTFEFAAPGKVGGFYGLQFRGAGYAAVKGWKRAGT